MADRANRKKANAKRTAAQRANQRMQQQRRAPAPVPPAEYTHSANMPGYDDELMPPRPAHKAVDNGIAFPTGRGTGTERSRAAQSYASGRPSASRTATAAAGERQAQKKKAEQKKRPPTRTNLRGQQRGAAQEPLEPYPLPNGAAKKRRGQAQNARPLAARQGQRTDQDDALNPWPTARKTQNAQTAQPREPAAREARRKKQVTKAMLRRRKLYRRLTAAALLLGVIAIGIFLTGTMFFKITSIEVRDADGVVSEQIGSYTSSQILTALGVQTDENIFSFNASKRAAQMEKLLPLLENIQIQRKYPGTVVVRATPAAAVCATEAQAGWLTLSTSLKILTVEAVQPDLPVLYGGEPVSTQPGDALEYAAQNSEDGEDSDERMETLMQLLEELTDQGLVAGVTRLEYDDLDQLAFLYEDRISVLLGTVNELDYKMQFARYLLLNEDGKGCASTDTGTIDCSHVRTDGTLRPTFAQGDPTLPSGYDCTGKAAAADAAESEEEATGEAGEKAPDEEAQAADEAADAADEEDAATEDEFE
jgi:cell division protein FtsQ